jgi:hypothetical protein
MSHDLRQRRPSSSKIANVIPPAAVGLTLSSLLQASPQEHGPVHKLHVPLFYSILPSFLQKLISNLWFLSALLGPRWEPLYLVLLGSYLYIFADDDDNNGRSTQRSQLPKGSPIRVDMLDVYLVGNSDPGSRTSFSDGTGCVFCLSTFRHTHSYAVPNQDDATQWLNSLCHAKAESVRRSMRHAVSDSYPKSWAYYDSLGQTLVARKERIVQRMNEHDLNEMVEMSQFGGGGGPIRIPPIGRYG